MPALLRFADLEARRDPQGQLSSLEGPLTGSLSRSQQRLRRALHECRVWAYSVQKRGPVAAVGVPRD